MIVGYSFFVGDLFHVGHLNQLELDREYCDYLIAGVLTEEAVNYKPKPIIPLEERMRLFRALRAVDLVVVQDERDPTGTLQKLWDLGIKVEVLFHGSDWLDVPGKEWIEAHGGRLIQPPYYEGQSTSMIIDKILKERK